MLARAHTQTYTHLTLGEAKKKEEEALGGGWGNFKVTAEMRSHVYDNPP